MNKKFLIIGIVIIIITLGFLFYNYVLCKDNKVTGDPTNVVEANNQFAFDLYSKYSSEEGNIFFSPYSISSALAMTYEGARGQTADEIQSVFYFPEDTIRQEGYASLNQEINKKNKEYELNMANALWAENDFEFLDSYFDLINKYYDGKVTNLDFKSNAEKSRLTINRWIEEKTKNKIKDLIPSGSIDSLTRLILTNAIYFKGEWVKQFNEEDTRDLDFRLDSDEIVKIPIMKRIDDEAIFNYMENNKLQMLEMPYSGEELSMLLLLPKDGDIESLGTNIEDLDNWKNKLEEQRVNIYIPRFKFETKYFMNNTLSEIGMPLAFSNSADFSGMTGIKDLIISQVIHQAFVEVNEEGTEAAAATAVIMSLGSVGPSIGHKIPVFRADHPFIFIIQQKNSGNILFMGRVSDPRE